MRLLQTGGKTGTLESTEMTCRVWRNDHEAHAGPAGAVYPHPLLQEQVRLLRLLLPAPVRGPDGRLHRRPVRPPGGDRPLRRGPSGGHGVLRRRHPQLSGREAAGEDPEGHPEKIQGGQGRGDHPGGQPGLRRGLEGPALPAQMRLQPPLPGDAVRRRRRAGGDRPGPHHGPGDRRRGGRPEGQIRESLPGPDLRPAPPDAWRAGRPASPPPRTWRRSTCPATG